jgi:hypothetical protein
MSWIHNNLFLPLLEPERHKGLGGRLRSLQSFEASSPARQRAMQSESVRRLLEHAYRTTPYYRTLFDEQGIHPSDWKEFEPIPVPILSRDLVRAHEDDLRSRRYAADELRAAATGGTTSTPVRLWRDVEALRKKTALQYHLNRGAGFDQGDSILMIWGADRDLELNPSWKWKLYENWLMRRIPAASTDTGLPSRALPTLSAPPAPIGIARPSSSSPPKSLHKPSGRALRTPSAARLPNSTAAATLAWSPASASIIPDCTSILPAAWWSLLMRA